jgi:hypothetical protein
MTPRSKIIRNRQNRNHKEVREAVEKETKTTRSVKGMCRLVSHAKQSMASPMYKNRGITSMFVVNKDYEILSVLRLCQRDA